jgi:nickel transport protein
MRQFCLILALILCFPTLSSAHGVNIFAYVDGDRIVTDSGYSHSRRVNKGTVTVHAPDGRELLSGTTDETGHFAFPIPEEARDGSMDLKLVIHAGEGHQADWTVCASEIAPQSAQAATETETDEPAPTQAQETVPAREDVRRVVREELKKELAPVKAMLSQMHEQGPGLTEIFGGIGWLVGLGGLLAYARARRG